MVCNALWHGLMLIKIILKSPGGGYWYFWKEHMQTENLVYLFRIDVKNMVMMSPFQKSEPSRKAQLHSEHWSISLGMLNWRSFELCWLYLCIRSTNLNYICFSISITPPVTWQNVSQENRKEGRIYFSSEFKSTVHYGGEVTAMGAPGSAHIAAVLREQREMNVVLSLLCPFNSVQDSSLQDRAAHIWGPSSHLSWPGLETLHRHAQRCVS